MIKKANRINSTSIQANIVRSEIRKQCGSNGANTACVAGSNVSAELNVNSRLYG